MTALLSEADTPGVTAGQGRRRLVGKEDLGLLFGLPVICLAVLVGWVIWRNTATLDAIELNALEWPQVLRYLREHIQITLICAVCVVGTALPIGVLLTRARFRRYTGAVVTVANTGQAAPVIGVIVLLAMWLGFSMWTAVLALSAYAFLPVLRNTIVGLQGVDPTLVEAGRGMGMSAMAVLLRIELPIALPVIMTGVRTALVLLVGTAAFAHFINAGGLGGLIVTGINLFRMPVLLSGSILISVLALLVDWLGRVMEMLATPKGMR